MNSLVSLAEKKEKSVSQNFHLSPLENRDMLQATDGRRGLNREDTDVISASNIGTSKEKESEQISSKSDSQQRQNLIEDVLQFEGTGHCEADWAQERMTKLKMFDPTPIPVFSANNQMRRQITVESTQEADWKVKVAPPTDQVKLLRYFQKNNSLMIDGEVKNCTAANLNESQQSSSLLNPTVFQLNETTLRLQQQPFEETQVARHIVKIPKIVESDDIVITPALPVYKRPHKARSCDSSLKEDDSQQCCQDIYDDSSIIKVQEMAAVTTAVTSAPVASQMNQMLSTGPLSSSSQSQNPVPLRLLVAENNQQAANSASLYLKQSCSSPARTTTEYNYMPTTTMADELNKTETQVLIHDLEDDEEGVVQQADMDENEPLSGKQKYNSRDDQNTRLFNNLVVVPLPLQKQHQTQKSQPSMLKLRQSTNKPAIMQQSPELDTQSPEQDDDNEGGLLLQSGQGAQGDHFCSGFAPVEGFDEQEVNGKQGEDNTSDWKRSWLQAQQQQSTQPDTYESPQSCNRVFTNRVNRQMSQMPSITSEQYVVSAQQSKSFSMMAPAMAQNQTDEKNSNDENSSGRSVTVSMTADLLSCRNQNEQNREANQEGQSFSLLRGKTRLPDQSALYEDTLQAGLTENPSTEHHKQEEGSRMVHSNAFLLIQQQQQLPSSRVTSGKASFSLNNIVDLPPEQECEPEESEPMDVADELFTILPQQFQNTSPTPELSSTQQDLFEQRGQLCRTALDESKRNTTQQETPQTTSEMEQWYNPASQFNGTYSAKRSCQRQAKSAVSSVSTEDIEVTVKNCLNLVQPNAIEVTNQTPRHMQEDCVEDCVESLQVNAELQSDDEFDDAYGLAQESKVLAPKMHDKCQMNGLSDLDNQSQHRPISVCDEGRDSPELIILTGEQKMAQLFKKFGSVEIINEEQEDVVTVTSEQSLISYSPAQQQQLRPWLESKTQITHWNASLGSEQSDDRVSRLLKSDELRFISSTENKKQELVNSSNRVGNREINNTTPILAALQDLSELSQQLIEEVAQTATKKFKTSSTNPNALNNIITSSLQVKTEESPRNNARARDSKGKTGVAKHSLNNSDKMKSERQTKPSKGSLKSSLNGPSLREREYAMTVSQPNTKKWNELITSPSSSSQQDTPTHQSSKVIIPQKLLARHQQIINNSSLDSTRNSNGIGNSQSAKSPSSHARQSKKLTPVPGQPSFQKTRSMQYLANASRIKSQSTAHSHKLPFIAWKSTQNFSQRSMKQGSATAGTTSSIDIPDTSSQSTSIMETNISKSKMASRNHQGGVCKAISASKSTKMLLKATHTLNNMKQQSSLLTKSIESKRPQIGSYSPVRPSSRGFLSPFSGGAAQTVLSRETTSSAGQLSLTQKVALASCKAAGGNRSISIVDQIIGPKSPQSKNLQTTYSNSQKLNSSSTAAKSPTLLQYNNQIRSAAAKTIANRNRQKQQQSLQLSPPQFNNSSSGKLLAQRSTVQKSPGTDLVLQLKVCPQQQSTQRTPMTSGGPIISTPNGSSNRHIMAQTSGKTTLTGGSGGATSGKQQIVKENSQPKSFVIKSPPAYWLAQSKQIMHNYPQLKSRDLNAYQGNSQRTLNFRANHSGSFVTH